MPTTSEPSLGISVDGLGKRYKIVAPGTPRRFGPFAREPREELWALRDVSFDVPRGSTLGVIGRNGSGKTTLLKILSKVTPPTTGRAVLAGRMGSLLEVGTGFHPELTGRENVFMNGAILGMKKREIAAKFDEIVEFAEIEEFIDTPVKRYSSGMSLRLAFAVAAHLEPEILLVDEVLAVGDASFQAKSIGKMGEVTSHGRTVVIVSHSMPTIASLAEHCIWLEQGVIKEQGPPSEIIRNYLSSALAGATDDGKTIVARDRPSYLRQEVKFTHVRLVDASGEGRLRFYEGEPIAIVAEFDVVKSVPVLELRAYLKTSEGMWLFSVLSGTRYAVGAGRYRVVSTIDPNHLSPGRFSLDLIAGSGVPQDMAEGVIAFDVEHSAAGYDDPTLRGDVGRLRFPMRWEAPVRIGDLAANE